MKVYPNPATDEVCIDMTDARVYPQKVWVYDTTGSQMRKETFTGNQHCIDTSRLKAGTYFVVVSLSDGSQATSKVMVQH
jgi:hypothetical protein